MVKIRRIAIMGTGSLGTILGAYLSKAGMNVTLIDAWQEHVNALNTNGAKVSGKVNMIVPVHAITPDQMEGTYDLFIYLAKQTFNETAIPQMVAHCHKDSIICTGQNGIPELAVAEYWPKEQICGTTVGWSATLLGPGESALTCPVDSPIFNMHLGTLTGAATDWLFEIKFILENMCPVYITEHLMNDRWSKVLINATFSGMSTVINGTFWDAFCDEHSLECVVRIGRETIHVCHAMHITVPPIFGCDFDKLYDFHDKEGEQKAKNTILAMGKQSGDGKASMLQDLEKGKKCEISFIDGIVSKKGKELGVATPYTDAVVRIVQEIEDGKRPLSSKNIEDMPHLPV